MISRVRVIKKKVARGQNGSNKSTKSNPGSVETVAFRNQKAHVRKMSHRCSSSASPSVSVTKRWNKVYEYLLLLWQGAISEFPAHQLFSRFIKTHPGPYGPIAGVAAAQGVYLLLIGGISAQSGPGAALNLPSCLCPRRHGNRYPSSSKNPIGRD